MNQHNLDKLKNLRLPGMAEAYESLFQTPQFSTLSFDELLGLLLDHEESLRKSNKLNRLLKDAKFPMKAAIEDILYHDDRRLNKELILQLAAGKYLIDGRNIIFKGTSGNGKTFFATAFGVQACRQYKKVEYKRLPYLIEEFKLAKHQADGSYLKLMKKLVKTDLLILDEWLLYPLENDEATVLLEIINARHEAHKSNIYCSQLNTSGWYENLGNGTVAEAIMERIIHNAYDIQLDGNRSMREKLSFKHTEVS